MVGSSPATKRPELNRLTAPSNDNGGPLPARTGAAANPPAQTDLWRSPA